MIAPAGSHIDIPHQRQKFDIGLQTGRKTDAEIRLAAGNRFDDVTCTAIDKLDAYPWVTGLETADHVGHEIVGRRRHRGDGDQPHAILTDLIDIRQYRLDIRQ
ncbi:hypothetical protein D3C79_887090 [compost metagenome]